MGAMMLARVGAQAGEPSVRLAIVSQSPATAAAGDLLTAELSQHPSLQLLERTEIDRVYREQALSTANTDYLKLGRVLGADGLIILETVQKEGRTTLSTRLVAVKPGVILSMAEYPFPLSDPDPWSKLVIGQFQPLFGKLKVLPKDAIPISLLNLRAALKGRETESLEREMNILLLSRLTSEREFFVLERQKLEALANEKEYQPFVDSPFWNGSYVLDGIIDKNGYDPSIVTVSARLAPPGKPVVDLEVQGSRTNLPRLINELTLKLLSTLRRQGDNSGWSPADEAKQYLDEARWAAKWNLLKQAQSASEASWALGDRTPEADKLRIGIYRAESAPHWGGGLAPNSNAGLDPNQLAPAITALQLYVDSLRIFPPSDTNIDVDWYEFGLGMIEADSELLQQFYYFDPNASREHKDDLADLRAWLRRTADAVSARHFLGKSSSPINGLFVGEHNNRAQDLLITPVDINALKAADGALWCETPEECLELHREFVRSGVFDRMFGFMSYQEIIAWNPEDKPRVVPLWEQFRREICNSTNGLTKIGGYYLAFTDSASDEEYRTRALEFFHVAADNAYAIVSAGLTGAFTHRIEETLGSPPGGMPARQVWNSAQQYYYNTFKTDFTLHSLRDYLDLDNRFDTLELAVTYGSPVYRPQPFTAEQSQELLSALDRYKARVLQKQAEHPFRYDFQSYDSMVAMVTRTLGQKTAVALTNNTPQVSAPPVSASALRMRPRAPSFLSDGTQDVQLRGAGTNLLPVTRFWTMPPGWVDDDYDVFPAINILGVRFRERRLWLEIFNPSLLSGLHKAFIYGVDLNTFQTETIDLPFDKSVQEINGVSRDHFSTGNSFEVLGDFVYFNRGAGIQRYSLRTKTWEDLDVPVSGSLVLVGNRLFVVSHDIILEINKEGNGAAILASTRRRPAVTKLDLIGNFDGIFAGPNGAVRTIIGGKVYARDQAGDDWSVTADIPDRGTPISRDYLDGGALVKFSTPVPNSPAQDTHWWWLPDGRPSYEPLLMEPYTFHNLPNYPSANIGEAPRRAAGPVTTWKHPPELPLMAASAVMDHGNMFMFAGGLVMAETNAREPRLIEMNGHHALLVEFKRGTPEAVMVPLWFNLPDGVIPEDQMGKLLGVRSPAVATHPLGKTILHSTPQGLMITADHVPGFWLVPWADIDARANAILAERIAEQKAQAMEAERKWSELLARHHLNHRDNLTPEERESLIDDAEFIELEMPLIDANQNEQIDPDELSFFDANRNGVLDPSELAGLQHAWDLLAARVMSELDENGDGALDVWELPGPRRNNLRSSFVFPAPWLNNRLMSMQNGRAGSVTLGDLRSLQENTTRALLPQPVVRPEMPPPNFNTMSDSEKKQVLAAIADRFTKAGHPDIKGLVETYWKNQSLAASAATTNPPPAQKSP
jgi:hypothetical protein